MERKLAPSTLVPYIAGLSHGVCGENSLLVNGKQLPIRVCGRTGNTYLHICTNGVKVGKFIGKGTYFRKHEYLSVW